LPPRGSSPTVSWRRWRPQIPDLFAKYSIDAIDWKVYFNSIVAQGIVVIPGFLILGAGSG